MTAPSLTKTLSNATEQWVSDAEAQSYLEKWLAAYPAVAEWRKRQWAAVQRTHKVITPAGRVQRLAPCATEETRELTPQRAYNTPIQAGAGEVLLASLRILMEQLGEAGLTAKGVSPIAVIHDEIILEAPANLARLTGAVLESAMRDGMKELFPDAPVSGKFLEVSIGDSWADK